MKSGLRMKKINLRHGLQRLSRYLNPLQKNPLGLILQNPLIKELTVTGFIHLAVLLEAITQLEDLKVL